MKAVITVLGQDKVGIIAAVSALLAEKNVNILDISQTTMQNIFTMIMLCDIENMQGSFDMLSGSLNEIGERMGLSVTVQREDIFNSMHRI